jgi:hypothetical protein
VTEPFDVHADFVISELKKRDVPVFRFHTEDFPVGSQVSISGAGTAWSAEICTPLRFLRLPDVRARLGRGTAVKALWARNPVSYDGSRRLPLTTAWPENVDPALVATIRLAPAVFQEYVPKRREIRVVVIGREVFAASVNSQAIPAARHDVRAGTGQAGYEPYDLPADIRTALLEFTRGFGLRFRSADLVLTPDGPNHRIAERKARPDVLKPSRIQAGDPVPSYRVWAMRHPCWWRDGPL